MKRLTLLLGALLLTAAALAQTAVPPTVRIAHGPYVLNVTEDGFTVVWDAKADAIGWVELAPMDGSHFYSAERPRYYDSHLGLCRVGRMQTKDRQYRCIPERVPQCKTQVLLRNQ